MQSADIAPWALRTRSQAIPSALCREWIRNKLVKLVVKTGAGHCLVSQKPSLVSFCFWMVRIAFFFNIFSRLQIKERDIQFSFSKSVFQGTKFLSLISLSSFIFAPGPWLDRVGVLHVRKIGAVLQAMSVQSIVWRHLMSANSQLIDSLNGRYRFLAVKIITYPKTNSTVFWTLDPLGQHRIPSQLKTGPLKGTSSCSKDTLKIPTSLLPCQRMI